MLLSPIDKGDGYEKDGPNSFLAFYHEPDPLSFQPFWSPWAFFHLLRSYGERPTLGWILPGEP
jgi:hypothetical protein